LLVVPKLTGVVAASRRADTPREGATNDKVIIRMIKIGRNLNLGILFVLLTKKSHLGMA